MNAMGKWVLAVVWSAAAVSAGAQALEPGLKQIMDQSGLKYGTTKAGNATVTYSLDDDRTQVVYVAAKTRNLGGLVLREVWSNAGEVDAYADTDLLVSLLTGGGQEPLGAWNLEEADDGHLVYYSALVPAILEPEALKAVLESLAEVADRMEATLSDADDN